MSRRQHAIDIIGGATKTLQEWRVLSCVTRHRLGGEDVMELVIDREVGEALPFEPFSRLRLLDPDGQPRFVGRVLEPQRQASVGAQTVSIGVAGAWSYLMADTYQQDAFFAVDPAVESPVTGLQPVGRVILNRDPATGEKIKIAPQIAAALDYSISEGAPIEYETARIPDVEAPEDQAVDLRVSDVIRRCLGWAPHVGCRWEYGGLKPKLIFDDTIDPSPFAGGFAEREIAVTDVDGGQDGLQGRPRYDLLCPEFRIVYIYETEFSNVRWNSLAQDISTAPAGSDAENAYGRQISTVVLRGSVWDGTNYSAPEERPPNGLAASMHKAYRSLFYELGWSQTATEVDWTAAPGDLFSVTGTYDFAEARSVCQQITRDIQTGRTSFQCGPPVFLGLADRIALLVPNRIRGQSNAAGESTHGFRDRKKPEPEGYTEKQVRAMVRDGDSFVPSSGYVMFKAAP